MKPIRTTHVTALRRSWIVLPVAIVALAGLAIVVSGTASMYAASPGYSFRVVAALGDGAPGGGEHEGDFEPQDINASGSVLFASDLADEDGHFAGEGVFLRQRGVTSVIARDGQEAPGTGGHHFSGFGILSPGAMNDAGDVAFAFSLDPPDPLLLNTGLWRYSAATGTLSKVLLPGDPAPGGTTFRGAHFHADINNTGEIANVAIVDTPYGHCTDQGAWCYGLGRGVYRFDRWNNVAQVAAPGDPAPGSSSTFDDAWDPNISDSGDVVFGGHVTGEDCIGGSGSDIGCYESLYLYRASTGRLTSLVHQGDPAPGGGVFEFAFDGRSNGIGHISFIGGNGTFDTGVFLYTRSGSVLKVAAPGDNMPGGGTMVNTTLSQGAHAINGGGDVAFVARLDTDANGDGEKDTGVYLYRRGTIIPVVRTGTAIPGLGTVAHTNRTWEVACGSLCPWPWPGVHLNDRGEILTQVILENGDNYIVVATPW
jgi:hypothetical protein